ncbi:delta 9-fatty acid desaturase [Mycena rebaudengoi]|nr:delta 9-fatty acid desaturase [Mycena rebaudengoi]
MPPSPSSGSVEVPEIENYAVHVLETSKPRPPVTWGNSLEELDWINTGSLCLSLTLAFVGAYFTKLRWQTALFSCFYYWFTGLSITAGYHRFWSHRSYNAGTFLQYVFALGGAGAIQNSIVHWSRNHRAHHSRYTDTKLDPYNAADGFWHSHVGWLLFKPRYKMGSVDITDLTKSIIVQWQHDNYILLALLMGFIVPTVIPWLAWGDARGGCVYAALVRLCCLYQATACVNSLAHWIGEAPFDDKHTPRDHFITALITAGEGYHNFHHQFPMDYRSAIKWYQYDPTKWLIWTCQKLGLASHLKVFPDNEVRKGQLTMQLRRLREVQDSLVWPPNSNNLPIINWQSYQTQCLERPLILISGFIHDVSTFTEEHPGGAHLIDKFTGKDATTAFFGGVYEHSNAAHNLLAMKRVGVLHGGMAHVLDDNTVPPSQRLRIHSHDQVRSSSATLDVSKL